MKIVNVNEGKSDESEFTFSSVKKEILRDEILLISPHNTDTRQFYAGMATIYPGCRSRGHSHDENEEICFIIKGKGRVVVEGEENEVEAGDMIYIPRGKFHMFKNPNKTTLELVFVISPPKR
jgi:quercetin dioxygenase-like cupin family protein